MSVDAAGQWSAFEVAIKVSRQNGKGSILEVRQLGGLFLLNEPLQVHTAHEFKTAYEHFLRITHLIEAAPDLDRQVMRVRRGAGEQAVELKNGCRLRFLARSTGSGRGMTGDVVYLDEAYALTTPMMGALLPTLSAVPNPQVWYTSSACRPESEVLHSVTKRGRAGSAGRLFYADWGLVGEVDPDDVDGWYLSNPTLGIRISEEFVRAEWDALRDMPEEFLRERLGVDDALAGTDVETVIDPERWSTLADGDSFIASDEVIALVVADDRQWAAFGRAGLRSDGKIHGEVPERRRGTAWVVDRAVEGYQRNQVPVVIEQGSPAASFIEALERRGVEVRTIGTRDHAECVGRLIDAVDNDNLRHLGGSWIPKALKCAVLRPSGDVSVWSMRKSDDDITALVALTLAVGMVPSGPSEFFAY